MVKKKTRARKSERPAAGARQDDRLYLRINSQLKRRVLRAAARRGFVDKNSEPDISWFVRAVLQDAVES